MPGLSASEVLHILLNRDKCSCTLCGQISTTRMDSDLRALHEATDTNFKIVCQHREWNTHRVFLQRCPFFKKVVSPDGDHQWRETVEGVMTIGDFEAFEVEWLLRAIYADSWLAIYPERLKDENPNRSIMDTCVRMYTIGDYFLMPIMKEIALIALRHHTAIKSEYAIVTAMSRSIPYLPELEAGIRVAWTLPRQTDEVRIPLLEMCRESSPYLARNPSFARLLDQVPGFAQDLSKTLLGFQSVSLPTVQLGRMDGRCVVCKASIIKNFNQAGQNAGTGPGNADARKAMLLPVGSLAICSRPQRLVCSVKCFQHALSS